MEGGGAEWRAEEGVGDDGGGNFRGVVPPGCGAKNLSFCKTRGDGDVHKQRINSKGIK